MKRWFVIIDFVAVAIIVMMVSIWHKQMNILRSEYDTERLSLSIERAGEAAFVSALSSGDLGIGYTDFGDVSMSPSSCLDVFEEMICLNYDMAVSEKNKAYIEDCIPAAILACNDGYYITKHGALEEDDLSVAAEGELGLYWSVKYPYLLEEDSASKTQSLALYLNSEKWIKSTYDKMSGKFDLSYGNSYSDTEVSGMVDKDTAKRVINSTLSSAFTYATEQTSKLRGATGYNVYLPPVKTQTGLNPVEGPSFIIVLQGADFSGEAVIKEACISGYAVQKTTYVLGFMDNDGVKRYCYEGQLPDSLVSTDLEFFYSVEEAAGAGFEPAFSYMCKKR